MPARHGCYQGELFAPFVPLMLCVQVTVSTTKERPITSLTVRLDQGATQLAAIEVPSGDFERSIPPQPEDAPRWPASIGVMLAPFSVTEPGELRVVVITEEGEMLGPRLRIKVMPQAEDFITSAQPVTASAVTPKATSKKVATRSASTKKVPGKH